MTKRGKIGMVAAAVIMAAAIAGAASLGAVYGIGPFGFIRTRKIAKASGNTDPRYFLENVEVLENSPLKGKRICFLGSSVTEGAASQSVSFVEYLAKRNAFSYVKEAVGGTTLADIGETSYIQRMRRNIDTGEQFDAFICQLSTNDATRKLELGGISDSRELEDFNTSTVIGAMEYIICYAQRTWNCPVIFYTGTKYDSENYAAMVAALPALREKWGIGEIDLWNDEEMNQVSRDDYKLYMFDKIHPPEAA